MTKRIGIIGQPCIDEIISPNGEMISQSLGGILYSYAALERAAQESAADVEFLPLTWTSIPDREILLPFYSGLHHFRDLTKLFPTDSLTNRVRLVYSDEKHRSEHCPIILPPLTSEELSWVDLASLDGLFINMISGFDISLETLQWIRSKTDAYIHLDIHALVLGELSTIETLPRVITGRKDWREWVSVVDSVQMNETESDWLGAPEIITEKNLLSEIRRLFLQNGRPLTAVITRSDRGATLFDFQHEKIWNKEPTKRIISDTTGSGDVFGALYTLTRTLGTSEQEALWHAETWAGWNTELHGPENILIAPLSDEIRS
ncbi:MAG: carbohydrate kinase family protein [Bacteroidota bacterium]|nr:carbohydrate kinase family protein [Bacteroidota bacterium]MDP4229474.1 carbohydrate kinase family protein [Bacteroidota bacterium]MDP4236660.1 carbohydrate kinase family protein [Bacteroidota bacterium]